MKRASLIVFVLVMWLATCKAPEPKAPAPSRPPTQMEVPAADRAAPPTPMDARLLQTKLPAAPFDEVWTVQNR